MHDLTCPSRRTLQVLLRANGSKILLDKLNKGASKMQSKTLNKSTINQLKAQLFRTPSKKILKNRFKATQQAACNGVCATGRCQAISK
jgi:hypothetical protein